MERYERIYMSRKQMIINNFIGGISWGAGATIGLALFFAVLGLVLNKIDWIPVVGEFLTKLNVYISQNTPHLLK